MKTQDNSSPRSETFSQVAYTPPTQRASLKELIAERGISNARIGWLAEVRTARVCDYVAGRKKKCGKENVKKIRYALVYLGLEPDLRESRRSGRLLRFAKKYRAFHGAKIPTVHWSLNSVRLAVAMKLLQKHLVRPITDWEAFFDPGVA